MKRIHMVVAHASDCTSYPVSSQGTGQFVPHRAQRKSRVTFAPTAQTALFETAPREERDIASKFDCRASDINLAIKFL
jgi:hypothetical protein